MADEHEDFVGLAEVYVIGGLPDAERIAFETHLRTCAECVADVEGLQETVVALSIPDARLPKGLRETVFAAVDAERSADGSGSRADVARAVGERAEAKRAESAAQADSAPDVVDLVARRRRARVWLAAACAVVVAVGAAVVMWRVNDTPASAPVANPPMVESVLAAPDMTKATGALAQGTVAAMYAPSQRATVVATADLPSIPSNMMYQVWITVGGKTKSAGMVPGGQRDKSMVVMTEMDRPSTVGLSVEPAVGSSQPTSPMVVDFPVP